MDTEVELQDIERILTEIIGRPSRWSGRVELTDDPEIFGSKSFGCDITVSRSLVARDLRWRTLIHELLHSYSAGYSRQDYDEARGWEEGAVEQLQRLLRPDLLLRLGITADEAVFHQEEAKHRYNSYVAALEALRSTLGLDGVNFYLDLLAVPIRDRAGLLLRPGLVMPPAQRSEYVRTFSRSDAALKERDPR